jgi:pimeloyl-ACP methyl ester carboxylesterase
MSNITSRDGTRIAFEREGSGPAVILVGGGLVDRSENTPLVPELAGCFTVFNYDRRGRGESGDTLHYAVEREIEDLAALVTEAGGSAHLYGVSSGGALALEAAAAGLAVHKVAVYEVPYSIGHEAADRWQHYVEQLSAALGHDRRDVALELFMRVAGSPEQMIEDAKNSPYWAGMEEIAHTLAYDAAILGDGAPPVARLAQVSQPVLIATGGTVEFFELAADSVMAALPAGQRLILEGQEHMANPAVLAPTLTEFFRA